MGGRTASTPSGVPYVAATRRPHALAVLLHLELSFLSSRSARIASSFPSKRLLSVATVCRILHAWSKSLKNHSDSYGLAQVLVRQPNGSDLCHCRVLKDGLEQK